MSSSSCWKETVGCGIHYHEIVKGLVGYDVLDRLKFHERELLDEMTKYNMAPRLTIVAMKDRDSNNQTNTTHVYKARSTYQSTIRGTFTKIQHLSKQIHDEKHMSWTKNKKESYVIIDIF